MILLTLFIRFQVSEIYMQMLEFVLASIQSGKEELAVSPLIAKYGNGFHYRPYNGLPLEKGAPPYSSFVSFALLSPVIRNISVSLSLLARVLYLPVLRYKCYMATCPKLNLAQA